MATRLQRPRVHTTRAHTRTHAHTVTSTSSGGRDGARRGMHRRGGGQHGWKSFKPSTDRWCLAMEKLWASPHPTPTRPSTSTSPLHLTIALRNVMLPLGRAQSARHGPTTFHPKREHGGTQISASRRPPPSHTHTLGTSPSSLQRSGCPMKHNQPTHVHMPQGYLHGAVQASTAAATVQIRGSGQEAASMRARRWAEATAPTARPGHKNGCVAHPAPRTKPRGESIRLKVRNGNSSQPHLWPQAELAAAQHQQAL